MIALAPALSMTLALAAADPQPPQVAALILPLRPSGSISGKQASGIRFTLKSAVEQGGYAKVLSDSRDDSKQADRCELDIACLREIAALRGADIIVAGEIAPAPDGLRVKLVAVGAGDIERRLPVTLQGNAVDDTADVDRAMRVLVEPRALRGAIFVEGERGARVLIDGQQVGTLPLGAQINDIVEGSHEVVVLLGEREMFRRSVAVIHAETTMVRAVLLDQGKIAADPSVAQDPGPPIAAIATTSVGAALLVAGAVCGTFSLFASWEAEARAKEQQLLFPRDQGLLWRGQALAWTANGLYVIGAVGVGAGAALFVLGSGTEDAP